jgi:hypothetical protein
MRPTEVVRETEGAKPPRFTMSEPDAHTYVLEASTPCPECGGKWVKLRYDMGAMLGE